MRDLVLLLSLLLFAFADSAVASTDAIASPLVFQAPSDCGSVSGASWQALNTTLGGRLYAGVPYARPCYSKYSSPLGTFTGADHTACETRISNSANDLYRQNYFGSYGSSVAESCTALNQFCTYGSNSSDPHFTPPAVCYQGSIPTYYIDVRNANDVATAFTFVSRHNLQLTIKGAGHEYWGRSSAPGSLALWTYNLKNITLNRSFVQTGAPAGTAVTPAVTVGAGVVFDEIYKYAHANNFVFLGGACVGVGASGGWFMGGGIGAMANTMGVGSDRVIEFKIVTPDGQLRIANAYQNTDLFFAVRGGGPATYGVVLESTHKIDPPYALQTVFALFNSSVPGVQRQFYETVVNNTLTWANAGWGGYLFSSGIAYVNPRLNAADASTSMAPLLNFLNDLPAGVVLTGPAAIQTLPSFYEFEYGLIAPIAASGTTGSAGTAIGGRLLQERNFNTDAAKVQTVNTLMNFIQYLQPYDPAMPMSIMVIQVSGPYLYSKEHPDAASTTGLNPGWRSGIMYVEAGFKWGEDAGPSEIKNFFKLAHDSIAGLRAITPKTAATDAVAYINEGDMYATDWQGDFFGSHYAKLLAIKLKYDPQVLLKPCWKCVGWTSLSSLADRFKCYFKTV